MRENIAVHGAIAVAIVASLAFGCGGTGAAEGNRELQSLDNRGAQLEKKLAAIAQRRAANEQADARRRSALAAPATQPLEVVDCTQLPGVTLIEVRNTPDMRGAPPYLHLDTKIRVRSDRIRSARMNVDYLDARGFVLGQYTNTVGLKEGETELTSWVMLPAEVRTLVATTDVTFAESFQ